MPLSLLIIFFSSWYLTNILSVNQVPRAVQDRTLNKQMKSNFENRMKEAAGKK